MSIRPFVFKSLSLIMGILIAFIILEVILQIYNPFGFRQKGDKIVLPANIKTKYYNKTITGLDSSILFTRNSIGFRGPEIPDNLSEKTSIIAVGGSTTECRYISDGKDWVSLLSDNLNSKLGNVWVNNAGLDGHSTFGHYILVSDHILKLQPKYILFLVGCNDIERMDLSNYDDSNLKESKKVKSYLKNNSESISLFLNLKRSWNAHAKNLGHKSPNFSDLTLVDTINKNYLKDLPKSQDIYLEKYEQRLNTLIQLVLENNIIPVLITQPTLVGSGIDEVYNIDLEKIKYCDNNGGLAYWTKLELYNNVSRKIASENDIPLIDLSVELKKSTVNFYDCLHFTNAGSLSVSKIISNQMLDIIYEKPFKEK